MKLLVNGRFVIAVLTLACLATVLLTVVPIRSGTPGPGEYDPWLDWNDDGKIDMKDIGRVASAFGTGGQNISKASLAYDSGWLDLRNETGEYYTITHNLKDTELQVDARKITPGWNKTYGGINLDWMYSMVQTSDEGYALTGRTESFGTGGTDFWLVKTDASGNMMWNQTYGGTGYDGAWALVQTREGGYALVGSTTSFGTGDLDFWLVKTNSAGTMQWNRTYGGTDFDYASALVQTSDEGYALAGRTESFGAGNSDFWLVKTDAAGNAQWNRTYGGTDTDEAYALVQTGDGGYALAGYTWSFGAGSNDFWLVKTNSAGTMQWNRTYGGTSRDEAYALVQTGDGGYALAGYTESFGTGDDLDFWLVKTDVESGLAWMYSSANTITLYRGATDVHWNFVRVRLWKPHETP
jgi:predicted secreted protein